MDVLASVTRLQEADTFRPAVRTARGHFREARDRANRAEAHVRSKTAHRDDALSRLQELRSGRGAKLASFGQARLYEYRIEMPGYSGPVTGARATLAELGSVQKVPIVSGETKGGLGGAVVGGIAFGVPGAILGTVLTRKTEVTTHVQAVDSRKIELVITGPGYAWSTTSDLNTMDSLRRFRDLVNARSSVDIQQLVAAQEQTVARIQVSLGQAQRALDSARAEEDARRAEYLPLWNRYATLRLPLLLDMRVRWTRLSTLTKTLFIVAIAVPPATGLTVIALLTTSVLPLSRVSIAVGISGPICLAATIGFYFSRVRLLK